MTGQFKSQSSIPDDCSHDCSQSNFAQALAMKEKAIGFLLPERGCLLVIPIVKYLLQLQKVLNLPLGHSVPQKRLLRQKQLRQKQLLYQPVCQYKGLIADYIIYLIIYPIFAATAPSQPSRSMERSTLTTVIHRVSAGGFMTFATVHSLTKSSVLLRTFLVTFGISMELVQIGNRRRNREVGRDCLKMRVRFRHLLLK